MKLPITQIIVGPRHRVDMGDIDALAKSIGELGLMHPIVIDMEHRLIAGARRLKAAQQLGWTEIEVTILDMEHLVEGEYAENMARKDFTDSERVAIGREIEQRIGDRRGSNQHKAKELPQDVVEAPGIETAEIAAKGAGFGNAETYRQAKCAVENGAAELVAALDAGTVSISAAKEVATLPLEQQASIVAQGPEAVKAAARELREARKQAREARKQAREAGERERAEQRKEKSARVAEARRAADEFVGWIVSKIEPGELPVVLAMVEKINGNFVWDRLDERLREANGGPWDDDEPYDESPAPLTPAPCAESTPAGP